MHACPCGYFGDSTRECRCTGGIIQRYLSKISGPLLDRIDLHIEVPAVAFQELRGKGDGVSSAEMRERVAQARALQQQRGFYNAHIPHNQLRKLTDRDGGDVPLYDGFGNVARGSDPYRGSPDWTENTYDELGRRIPSNRRMAVGWSRARTSAMASSNHSIR